VLTVVWFVTGGGSSGVSCEVLTGYLSVCAGVTDRAGVWHWAECFVVWFGTGSGSSGVSWEVLTGYLSVCAGLAVTGPVCGIGQSVLWCGLVQEVAAVAYREKC
jgi:hypothetical protein